MTQQLYLAYTPGELRLAVVQDDELLDYTLWRPDFPDGVGDLYHGRIATLVPAMGGAFVNIGLGGQQGFLSLSGNQAQLTEGHNLIVQVTRAALGGKGLRLRLPQGTQPDLPASSQPGLISRGPTPLERLAQLWPQAELCADSPEAAALIPPALRDRRRRLFQPVPASINQACDALADTIVTLPGRMSASITPTPALIAIDMDAPPSASGQTKQTAQFAANRDALPVLLHQIRLRNLSGAILIDPAGLAVKKRQALLEPVRAMLKADPLQPRCLDITALGLIEIVRARIHPSLPELFTSPQGRALAALRAMCSEDAAQATQLRGSLRLIAILETIPQTVADCARLRGKPFTLKSDPSLPDLSWRTDTND